MGREAYSLTADSNSLLRYFLGARDAVLLLPPVLIAVCFSVTHLGSEVRQTWIQIQLCIYCLTLDHLPTQKTSNFQFPGPVVT